MNSEKQRRTALSRRQFVKSTAAAAAAMSAGIVRPSSAVGAAETLRVGLVGCGGRGTGAARDAAVAAEGVEIYAMGDLFENRLDQSREALAEAIGEKLNVTDERAFIGFDAYQHVIDAGVDIVILATPPGFRPEHLRAAVDADKHVFMEKPVAVDVEGYHDIVASGEAARAKNLSIVAGTLYRRQNSFTEAVKRIHDGAIGDLVSANAYYLTGPVWLRERQPGMSDTEWQCRNWYYFTWLSGDHIVEQFVHNLDVLQWVFDAVPESALAMGGRIQRVDPSYGHIYDHFSVEYAFPGDIRVEAKSRQMEGVARRVTNRIVGTKGIADLHTDRSMIVSHDGEVILRHPERGNNGYVQEHTDLIAAIRSGKPINEARQVADSTMIGILGRESAYTGLELTWEELLQSPLDLAPEIAAFKALPSVEVPRPGYTTLDRAPLAAAG